MIGRQKRMEVTAVMMKQKYHSFLVVIMEKLSHT